MPAKDSRIILPDPPPALKELSRTLRGKMLERIDSKGPLSFAQYMEMALYEPGLGYYSAGLPKLGEAGDFVTAPELGDLFARCLALQARDIGRALDGRWEVLEVGAGTGRMAADFLRAFDGPGETEGPQRYRILERSAHLRAEQMDTIAAVAPAWLKRVEWLEEPPTQPWEGVLLANEVIDALPVERFRMGPDGFEQLGVQRAGESLDWTSWPAPEELVGQLEQRWERLDARPAVNYTSEICPLLTPWIQSVTGSLTRGVAVFVDYGYARREYYLPERADGTLVCHYQHRAHDDPFWWPGLQDITAFVDFTALAEAADSHGLEVAGYTSQAMFLLGCGLEHLLADIADLPPARRHALAHEVRELTLPEAMGEKFQCMALSRDLDIPLRGFAWSDLRGNL